MRKVFTLVLALALVLSTAAVFAQEDFEPSVNVGGSFDWGYNYNHGEDIYVDTVDTAELVVSGQPDPFNTFTVTLAINDPDATADAAEVQWDNTTLTTDLGALFGAEDLGFGLTWTNGFTDPGRTIAAGVTRLGFSDDAVDTDDLALRKDWTSQISVPVLDIFTLNAMWGWDVAAAETSGEDEAVDALVEGVFTVGGATVGVAYATNEVTGGAFGANVGVDVASFVPTLADLGVGVDFGASVASDLAADDADSSDYDNADGLAAGQTGWGVGLKGSYTVADFPAMADLGVSYYGSTEVDETGLTASPNTVIGIDGGVMLFEMVELYGAVALDFTDYEDLGTSATNPEGLSGGEVGTKIMVGSATFDIGYYFVNEDFDGWYSGGDVESFAAGAAATDDDGNAVGHAFFNTSFSF